MKNSLRLSLIALAAFSLVGCANNGTGSSSVPEESVPGALTYEQYAAAAEGTTVTVVSYIQDKEGFWTDSAKGGTATLYTQDQDGAYFAYNAHMTEAVYNTLTTGTRVKLTGEISNYAGQHELYEPTVTVISGAPYVADATDITSVLGTNKLQDYMNRYVTLKNGVVQAFSEGSTQGYGYGWDGSGTAGQSDVYFNVKFGDSLVISMNVRRYLRDATTTVYNTATTLVAGDTITVTGFLYWYQTAAQPRVVSITK